MNKNMVEQERSSGIEQALNALLFMMMVAGLIGFYFVITKSARGESVWLELGLILALMLSAKMIKKIRKR